MEHDETDISTNQELHFKPLDIADIKNIPGFYCVSLILVLYSPFVWLLKPL